MNKTAAAFPWPVFGLNGLTFVVAIAYAFQYLYPNDGLVGYYGVGSLPLLLIIVGLTSSALRGCGAEGRSFAFGAITSRYEPIAHNAPFGYLPGLWMRYSSSCGWVSTSGSQHDCLGAHRRLVREESAQSGASILAVIFYPLSCCPPWR